MNATEIVFHITQGLMLSIAVMIPLLMALFMFGMVRKTALRALGKKPSRR